MQCHLHNKHENSCSTHFVTPTGQLADRAEIENNSSRISHRTSSHLKFAPTDTIVPLSMSMSNEDVSDLTYKILGCASKITYVPHRFMYSHLTNSYLFFGAYFSIDMRSYCITYLVRE